MQIIALPAISLMRIRYHSGLIATWAKRLLHWAGASHANFDPALP